MPTLADLPDINFVQADVVQMQNLLITHYEKEAKRQLAPADPLRIFFLSQAYYLLQQRVLINQIAKGQLLRYATYPVLDHIGAMFKVFRLAAEAAKTTIQFTLSIPLSSVQTIPAGTRIGTTDGDGTIYFSTLSTVNIPVGATMGTVQAICNQSGLIGNGYVSGQLTTLIDPLPYIQSVTNITESANGSDAETDDSLRERIQLSPESFSVAGPAGAYEYWAKTASTRIIDVSVSSPSPMQALIVILAQNGDIPGTELINKVHEVLNDETIRPLCDLVTVKAPDVISYNINTTYYIRKSQAAEQIAIQASVNQALESYMIWQKTKLGRDINPSELIARMINAGAYRADVISPTFQVVSSNQIARESTVTVTFGGLIDD